MKLNIYMYEIKFTFRKQYLFDRLCSIKEQRRLIQTKVHFNFCYSVLLIRILRILSPQRNANGQVLTPRFQNKAIVY